MERYTVCLILFTGTRREYAVRSNRAAMAAKVAVYAHESESGEPVRGIEWVAVEGARA